MKYKILVSPDRMKILISGHLLNSLLSQWALLVMLILKEVECWVFGLTGLECWLSVLFRKFIFIQFIAHNT